MDKESLPRRAKQSSTLLLPPPPAAQALFFTPNLQRRKPINSKKNPSIAKPEFYLFLKLVSETHTYNEPPRLCFNSTSTSTSTSRAEQSRAEEDELLPICRQNNNQQQQQGCEIPNWICFSFKQLAWSSYEFWCFCHTHTHTHTHKREKREREMIFIRLNLFIFYGAIFFFSISQNSKNKNLVQTLYTLPAFFYFILKINYLNLNLSFCLFRIKFSYFTSFCKVCSPFFMFIFIFLHLSEISHKYFWL